MHDDYISASEIGDYLYCRRAWWFRRQGASSANQPVMDTGTARHAELAQAVQHVERQGRIAGRLLLAAFLILLALLLLRGLLGAG